MEAQRQEDERRRLEVEQHARRLRAGLDEIAQMLGPFGPTPRLSESCPSTSMNIRPKEESVDHQAASSASSPTLPRETVLNTLGTNPPLEEQNLPQDESRDNGGIGLVVSAGSTDEESETEAHYAPNERSQHMVQTQSPTPSRTRSPHRPGRTRPSPRQEAPSTGQALFLASIS